MSDGMVISLVYEDTPPSMNAVGSRGGQGAFHREKKKWQDIFEQLLMATGFPRDWDEMTCSAELRFPTKQRRDEVNYRSLIEKALGDALVNGGWIPDDVPENFIFERVKFMQQPGRKLTTIHIAAK